MGEHFFTFILTTCQRGAEAALKREIMRRYPTLHPAYSRPGFVTFKAAGAQVTPHFRLESVFARAWSFSLGRLLGETAELRAVEAWEKTAAWPIRWVHVWSPDLLPPGGYDYEPKLSDEALGVHRLLMAHCPRPGQLALAASNPQAEARAGDWILDCVVVREDEWYLGVHVAGELPSRYPGGLLPLELPADAVSRAYLKMQEALLWSGFPVRPGGRWLEIGCAPGGSAQALLDKGQMVIGVDPAQVDARVMAHPNFTHIRRRISRVPRRLFAKVRWLSADMNVAPNYTLEVVESIVLNQYVSIRGMILMLKLLEWADAENLDQYLERIRAWGFNKIKARQLQYNRQEICVAALQQPFRRKPLPARLRRWRKLHRGGHLSTEGMPTPPSEGGAQGGIDPSQAQ